MLSALGEPAPLAEFPLATRIPFSPTRIFAVAAGCALAACLIIAFAWVRSTPRWEIVPLAGIPKVGAGDVTKGTNIHVGDRVQTDSQSKARLTYGKLAILEVEPNTSLRITQSQKSGYRLFLERGKLKAVIFAPPNLFFVDTPSAVAIDLGCTYTVELDEQGSSIVHVTHGLVSVQAHGGVSMVPGGAVCTVRKNAAPGTPYFCDANPSLIHALQDFDGTSSSQDLEAIFANARQKDVLSLWHLIAKTNGTDRAQVVDHVAALVAPPSNISREELLRANRLILNLWWKSIREEAFQPQAPLPN
jgi:hypothetical protein